MEEKNLANLIMTENLLSVKVHVVSSQLRVFNIPEN